ncbi:MAG TPA: nucleotidyltransferase substrate binding protein [Patescibacteria group bacterium]|nr:nucleotidyltransferase substrate binding protein [Patescibacteria group bacterium]
MKHPLFQSYKEALNRLKEALGREKDDLIRDAAIQRFEFTVELAWKSMQKRLQEEQILCRSPKECLREAFAFGLIEDDPGWIRAMEDRNLTSHTYDQKIAEEIFVRLSEYIRLFDELEKKLES